MDWISTLQIDRVGKFAHEHVDQIAYAMATSLVVVVSGPVNGLFGRIVGGWNFVLRTLFWVVLFTMGYPALAWGSRRILGQFLGDQKPMPLLVLTFLAFLGFGIWAGQRKNLR
jgi:hypothetical protein